MNSETLPACPAHGVRFVVPLDPEDREQHSASDATHRCAACGALLGPDCEVPIAPATIRPARTVAHEPTMQSLLQGDRGVGKGERRIAILRPITAGEYNDEVSALVGLYNKAVTRGDNVVKCTDLSASWCPRCGECKCSPASKLAGDMDEPQCPLHANSSTHAEEEGFVPGVLLSQMRVT